MNKALLDTDILSEVFKARDATVVAQAQSYEAVFGGFTISSVTVMEIVKGFHKIEHTEAIGRFFNLLQHTEVLPFDQDSAESAGRIMGDLERSRSCSRRRPFSDCLAT